MAHAARQIAVLSACCRRSEKNGRIRATSDLETKQKFYPNGNQNVF
jgi:hypothetical protein